MVGRTGKEDIMSKTYVIEEDIKSWVRKHREELFDDILEACEAGLDEEDNRVMIAILQTEKGATIMSLHNPDEIVNSLSKCERDYVRREDYERAARARDCGLAWSNRKEIYKEKGKQ
jgi:hypothetical protein